MTTGRGRVAVVTGAARGIGAAVVDALAGEGWHVVAVDVADDAAGAGYPLATPQELHAVADRWPGLVRAEQADVRDAAALAAVVDRVSAEHGGLDAAVAAAAVVAGGDALWETPADVLEALWRTDVVGVWNLATAAVPTMLLRPPPRQGRFVALASAAAHQGLWHLAAYTTVKHAVVGLVKGLATDLRGTGVCVTAVSPGSTRTAMLDATAALYGLDDTTVLAADHLVERLLEPAEVAEVVRWLCSPAASAVTGSVVHADGGFST